MADKLPIGIYVDMARSYGRELFMGVLRYARSEHCAWDFQGDPAHPTLHTLADCAGAIIQVRHQEALNTVRELDVPTVVALASTVVGDRPTVLPDDDKVGEIVARDLLSRGFRHLGFVTQRLSDGYSLERATGFDRTVREAGAMCHHFRPLAEVEPFDPSQKIDFDELVAWIKDLPTPLGVMADNDVRGRMVLEACHAAQREVPGQVAVIGVDNDEVLCETAEPPLSSVAMPFETMGYECGRLLDMLIRGQSPDPRRVVYEPLDVVTRSSSDTLALGDEDTLNAVRFIWDNARESINVEDVVKQTKCSRRSLERRFRRYLGRSPRDEIVRVRIEQAKRALAETDEAMPKVADMAGFANSKKLSTHFVKATGMTPTEYRRRFRLR